MGIRKAWDTFSAGTTIWGLLPTTWQTAIAAGAGAVTGYIGYTEGSLALGIFLAVGVFAFSMAGVYFALRIAAITGTFQRLSVHTIGLAQAIFDPENKMLNGINFTAVLKNDSQRLMFYRIRRANVSLARQVSDSNTVDKSVIVIQLGGDQTIYFATIGNVPVPKGGGEAPKGTLELEVEYGPAKDKLIYLFRYVGELHLGIKIAEEKDGKEGTMQLSPHVLLKELEHTRL